MKILLTIGDISITGGAERVVANLANALHTLGHEVCVLSFYRTNAELPYKIAPRLVFMHECSEENLRREFYQNPLKKLYFKHIYKPFLSLKIKTRYKDADAVIVSDWVFAPFFKRKNTRYIKISHSKFFRYNKRNDLFDALVVLTSQELPLWQNHKNVRVIPNFLPQIPSKNADYKQKVVLSVGRMDNGDQKGFSRLLDIWQLLARDEGFKNEFKQWRLVIVGDGVLKGELEAKIQGLGLENVSLKPFTKDIEREYLSASIYAMSSLWEGFGMVLAEASSCALPCVAFDVKTGPSDIISHEKSGFLVADGDLAGFAGRLKILMRDENLRREFGENAKKAVSEKFSKNAVLEKWQALLKSPQNQIKGQK